MFIYAGYSDKGAVSPVNQDCIMVNGEIRDNFEDTNADSFHAVVCDGVGGEAHGEMAARLTAESMAALKQPYQWTSIQQQLELANQSILEKQKADPLYFNMATTIAGVAFSGSHAVCFNIGDSRIYAFHDHAEQISIDHTYVQLLLNENPSITIKDIPEEQRRIVLKCLGREGGHKGAYMCLEPFQAGEMLLLSSDGLHDAVSACDIENILRDEQTLFEKCKALVSLAISGGSNDNISVIICKVV